MERETLLGIHRITCYCVQILHRARIEPSRQQILRQLPERVTGAPVHKRGSVRQRLLIEQNFVALSSYVVSVHWPLLTPQYEYLGWGEQGPVYRYNVTAQSDEVLQIRKTNPTPVILSEVRRIASRIVLRSRRVPSFMSLPPSSLEISGSPPRLAQSSRRPRSPQLLRLALSCPQTKKATGFRQ